MLPRRLVAFWQISQPKAKTAGFAVEKLALPGLLDRWPLATCYTFSDVVGDLALPRLQIAGLGRPTGDLEPGLGGNVGDLGDQRLLLPRCSGEPLVGRLGPAGAVHALEFSPERGGRLPVEFLHGLPAVELLAPLA